MKKFNVSWNEIIMHQSVVEAETEEEAIEIAMNNPPDQSENGGNEDAEAYELDEDEE